MSYNNKKEKFAVYGTLRKDQGNYNRILKGNSNFIGTNKVKGFKMFSLGGFPGIHADPNKDITVDVFEVDSPETKQRLDWLEGYNKETDTGMYVRRSIEIDGENVWIYIWNSQERGQAIEEGDWVNFIKN